MARIYKTRKARFKAALALAGMKQNDFLKANGDISRQHLNLVLSEKRESEALTEKVDRFIAKIEKAAGIAA